MRLPSILSVALLCVSLNAYADSVTFTLQNPAQTAAGGDTLQFYAMASAPSTNQGTEDLNALSLNINPVNHFTVDQDGFLNGFPLSLSPGDSYTGLLFELLIPTDATLATYMGTVLLRGGPSDSTIGTQSFSVDVTAASTTATPEPSSFLLLTTSTGLLAVYLHRRKRSSAADQ